MSLYRTWRPASFADLVGQDAVVRTLQTALSSGKLAHAYLFSGPRGSGKTSAAKILARCIDCERGPTPQPDNDCANCRAMLAGTALDVIEIDAASNRGIDEIRALRDSVKFAPASMRMKVFIIDEAHMLTREGANAFLKTLEEPPAHAVFILATTAPEALPPTILSRCQRYAFRRIPVSVMIERMRYIAAAEGIAIDDGALGAIAYRADGGLRDALTMLEQVASYAGGPVDAATVDAAFGTTGRAYARALVDAILATDASLALRTIDEASDAGADMLGLVRGAIGEYRHLLVARIDADLLSRDLSQGDAERVVALAGSTPQPKVVRGLRLLADALAAGRLSGNPRLELETAVLRLVVQGEDPSLEALATRVALLEAGAPTAVAAPPSARRAAQSIAPTIGPAEHRPERATPASVSAVDAVAVPGRIASSAPGTGASRTSQADASTAQRPAVHAESTAPPLGNAAPLAPKPPDATTSRPSSDAPIEAEPSSVDTVRSPGARNRVAGRLASAPDSGAAARPSPVEPAAVAPVATPASTDPSAPSPPTLQQIRSQWDRIRHRAQEGYKPLNGLLSQATVDALDGSALSIGVVDTLQEGFLRERAAIVERALADIMGTQLRVLFKARAGGARGARTTSSERSTPESAPDPDGEIDLMAYARRTIGTMETR